MKCNCLIFNNSMLNIKFQITGFYNTLWMNSLALYLNSVLLRFSTCPSTNIIKIMIYYEYLNKVFMSFVKSHELGLFIFLWNEE